MSRKFKRTWSLEAVVSCHLDGVPHPTVSEIVCCLTELLPCDHEEAERRFRQAVLEDELVVEWDEWRQDFVVSWGPSAEDKAPEWILRLNRRLS